MSYITAKSNCNDLIYIGSATKDFDGAFLVIVENNWPESGFCNFCITSLLELKKNYFLFIALIFWAVIFFWKKKKKLKDFNKSGIILKLQPSGILQREIFLKKEELKLKNMRMKVFNFLFKIAKNCKFRSKTYRFCFDL